MNVFHFWADELRFVSPGVENSDLKATIYKAIDNVWPCRACPTNY